MTSSFTLPGGDTYYRLFRAEPVALQANRHAQSPTSAGRHKVSTRWVHLNDESSPEIEVPTPPLREADYVGQIIAVVTPVTPS